MTITVEIKIVYGQQLIYPACEKSNIFAGIAGKKTLSKADLANIRALGFTVAIKPQVIL